MYIYVLFFIGFIIVLNVFLYRMVQYNKKRAKEYEKVKNSIKNTLKKYDEIKDKMPDYTYLRKNLISNISILQDVIEYNVPITLIEVEQFSVHQMKQIQYELAYNEFPKELINFLDKLEYLFILLDITNHPYRTLLKSIFKTDKKSNIVFHYIYIKN